MNKFFSFILYILILFYFSIEFDYELKGDITDEDFEILKLKYKECNITIPSLSIPIIFIPDIVIGHIKQDEKTREININVEIFNDVFSGYLYKDINDNSLWVKEDNYHHEDICYLGLSYTFPNSSSGLEKDEINLFILNKTGKLESPIFSFDKWNELKNDSVISKLYYGENHTDFVSKEGIIGKCKINENIEYWGCFFDNIYFGGNSISLISNETQDNYNIYFVSESYDIIFPSSFQSEFIRLTNESCKIYNGGHGDILMCDDFFESKDYIEMILSTEDMNITIEIDNLKRYKSIHNDLEKKSTRIKFHTHNYIMLPLSIFKQFHVQFDAENKIIKFYTNDTSLLQIKKEPHKEDSSSDSNGLTIFLVILIIIIVIIIGFGIFYFIKKRNKSHSEGEINKFNRFEDEEGQLNSMNEKVF